MPRRLNDPPYPQRSCCYCCPMVQGLSLLLTLDAVANIFVFYSNISHGNFFGEPSKGWTANNAHLSFFSSLVCLILISMGAVGLHREKPRLLRMYALRWYYGILLLALGLTYGLLDADSKCGKIYKELEESKPEMIPADNRDEFQRRWEKQCMFQFTATSLVSTLLLMLLYAYWSKVVTAVENHFRNLQGEELYVSRGGAEGASEVTIALEPIYTQPLVPIRTVDPWERQDRDSGSLGDIIITGTTALMTPVKPTYQPPDKNRDCGRKAGGSPDEEL